MTETMREISAQELIAKYIDEGGPSEVFDFVQTLANGERVKTQIRVQLLRSEQDIEALQAAQATARAAKEGSEYGDIYKEAQAHELLARALRSVVAHEVVPGSGKEQYPPLFVSAAHLRRAFNATEMAVLLNCYHIVKAKYGALETLEKGDAETWIARLSDPLRGPFFLSQLDSLHWPGLISLLAAMCKDLYQLAGLEPPTLPPISESTPEDSTSDTGSSGPQPSVSSTQDPSLKVPAGALLTKEQAREIVKKRK